MDQEFKNLLVAVIEGRITEPDRVRAILADARSVVETKKETLFAMQDLMHDAINVFVTGNPVRPAAG